MYTEIQSIREGDSSLEKKTNNPLRSAAMQWQLSPGVGFFRRHIMNTRTCTKCGKEKPATLDYFAKSGNKGNLRGDCKECNNAQRQASYKKNRERELANKKAYHQENQEEILNKKAKYREDNKEELRERNKTFYHNNKHRPEVHESKKQRSKKYASENKDKINEYFRNKRATDPKYRIMCSLRARLNAFLKGHNKSEATTLLIGCSQSELITHLENQFDEKMTWDNYGCYTPGEYRWHIDHIVPCDAFDPSSPEEQRACFNYKNLRPLEATENMSKSNKLPI